MLADTLKAIAGQRLVDTDGDVTHLELLPPATEQQIRELEAKLPGPLPDEIRAALAVTHRVRERSARVVRAARSRGLRTR